MDNLYWKEYLLLMKTSALKELNRERDIHLLAYLTEIAKQRKKQGKNLVPVYKTFEDFYDYKQKRKQLLGTEPTEREQKVISAIVQANQL